MHEEELNQPTYFDWFYTAWGYRDLYGSIPEVGQHVYVGLGNGIAHDESPYCFYPQGYYRTTVIARFGDGDEAEWVLRFHADYEEIWNNVHFGEIVDSGLEFAPDAESVSKPMLKLVKRVKTFTLWKH